MIQFMDVKFGWKKDAHMWMDCFAITQSARFLKNTEKMTRITFEKILRENDILWNDLVEIEVFNPNYVKTFFGKYPNVSEEAMEESKHFRKVEDEL